MAARRPALRDPGNPFSVSNSAFGAFSLSGGQDPARKALEDASEFRYHVELRYNNGQATNEEYLAAIATEMAAARVLAGSSDADTAQTGRRRVAELENRIFDINDRTAEANARAGGDESLLAYYQGRIGSMAPGTPAYLSMQTAITNLTESIANQREVDASRKASYDIAAARAAYENGTITDDQWLAALSTYAGAQKPGSAQEIEAKQTVIQWEHSIGRNRIIAAIEQNQADWDDLLAFDKAALSKLNPNSEAYRDAQAAYQNTQEHVLSELEKNAGGTGILDKYEEGKSSAAATLAWYKTLLAGPQFDDNPGIQEAIVGRIRNLTGAVQDEKDNFTIQQFNDNKIGPSEFAAYSKSRAADFVQGSADFNKWNGYYNDARNNLADDQIDQRYRVSQDIVELQIFIAKNSKPFDPGSSTSRRQIMNKDGTFRYEDVTTAQAPTASEQAAYKQRQAEVANAKTQLAEKQKQVAGIGGFLSSADRLKYLQNRQKGYAKNSAKWYSLQTQIDGTRDRIDYESFLSSNDGIKLGYPAKTQAGVAAAQAGAGPVGGGKAGTSAAGGGGGGAQTGGTGAVTDGKYTFKGRGFTGDDSSARGDSLHSGMDFSAPKGTPIYALADGTVTFAGNGGAGAAGAHAIGGGNTVNIKDGSGTFQYAHQDRFVVKVGDKVKKGQIIGYVGNTGPYVSGDHLHLTRLDLNGRAVDPLTVPGFNSPNAILSSLSGGTAVVSGVGPGGDVEPEESGPASRPRGPVPSPATPGGGPTVNQPGYDPVARARELTGGANVNVDSFMRAWRNRESGGNYDSKNTKTGAFGAYQFTPSEWSRYAAQYGGDSALPPTPQNQDKIARALAKDVYGQVGTWEAVANWTQTGGPITPAHLDPSKWNEKNRYVATDMVIRAGGTAPGVPTTAISVREGTGVPVNLEMEVGATVRGGARVSTTVPFDLPTNFSANAFEDLYDGIINGTLQGQSTMLYRDGNGNVVNVSLPDTPEEHRRITAELDTLRLNRAASTSQDNAGGDNAVAADFNFTTAYKQAGRNQLALLDMSYGGRQPGTVSSAAPQGLTKSVTALPIQPKTKKRPGGAEGSNALMGELRTNELYTPNPIAAGIALTEWTETYVSVKSRQAREAFEAGDIDIALHYQKDITDAVGEHGQATTQIAAYNKIAQQRTKAIYDEYGVLPGEAHPQVAADLERLATAGERLNAAVQPSEDLYTKIKPLIQTTSTGAPRFDQDGSVMLTPGTVRIASARQDGTIAVDYQNLPVTGAWGARDDKSLVDVWKPGYNGKPQSVKAKWTYGEVGTLVVPVDTNGDGRPDAEQTIPMYGRVVGLGTGYVENPLNPGHFAPNGIIFTATNARIETAVLDANGTPDPARQAIAWEDAAGNQYRIGYDEKNGVMQVYKLELKQTAAGGARRGQGPATYQGVPLSGQAAKDALKIAGLAVDPGRNDNQTLSFLFAPELSDPKTGRGPALAGAWVGFDYDTARDFVYSPAARKAGAETAAAATAFLSKFARNPIGAIVDAANYGRAAAEQGTFTPAIFRGAQDVMTTGMGTARPGPRLGPDFRYPGGVDPNAHPGALDMFSMNALLTPEQVALGAAGAGVNRGGIELRAVTGATPRLTPAYESVRRPEPVVRTGDVMAAGMTRPVLSPVPRASVAPPPRTVVTPKKTQGDVMATGSSYAPPKAKPVTKGVGALPARATASVTLKPIAKPPVAKKPESQQNKPLPKPKPAPKPVYSKANALPGQRF